MSNSKREPSPIDIYHVALRGVGRQIIFEDDEDRVFFMECLSSQTGEQGISLYAWCLMDNHVHLVVHASLEKISAMMRKIGTKYAMHFNKRYDRVGHLFQNRYMSVPVKDEAQLLTVIRYVHQNPEKDFESYLWSSYREYLYAPLYTRTTDVLSLFGSVEEFIEFHKLADETMTPKGRLTNREIIKIAQDALPGVDLYEIRSLDKPTRNDAIRRLRKEGLSIRQIERLTSISRGIVSRV